MTAKTLARSSGCKPFTIVPMLPSGGAEGIHFRTEDVLWRSHFSQCPAGVGSGACE
ncbi:hypothetical protein RRK58_001999 [Vibrio fluvialis]|nr:hypothetical protein [Vibrio fluvialis]